MGDSRLRSGRASDEYFDKYLFEGDPPLLREICEAMTALAATSEKGGRGKKGGGPRADAARNAPQASPLAARAP